MIMMRNISFADAVHIQNDGDGIGFLTHCGTCIPDFEAHPAASKTDRMVHRILNNRKVSEKIGESHGF
jgi:hypothetical protein